MNAFTFSQTPWELYFEKHTADTLSATHFLTLLEGESEDALEQAFGDLEAAAVALDISDLPHSVVSEPMEERLRLEEKLVLSGALLSSLTEGDPLRLYLEELAAIPVCGDIRLLAMELAEANLAGQEDTALCNSILNLSLSRVVELAGEYTGRGVLLLDLIQEGSMGLWQAILGYTQGDFEENRDWWIRQYMAKAVTLQARDSGVGGKLRSALEDYRAADRRLLTRIGRNPTVEEIALEMNVTPEQAMVYEDMLRTARMMEKAKAQPVQEPQEEEQSVENTAYFQSRQRILGMLSALSDEDARLLTMRFGLEGGLPLSPQEVGAKLGLTADEVISREAAALAVLRENG